MKIFPYSFVKLVKFEYVFNECAKYSEFLYLYYQKKHLTLFPLSIYSFIYIYSLIYSFFNNFQLLYAEILMKYNTFFIIKKRTKAEIDDKLVKQEI